LNRFHQDLSKSLRIIDFGGIFIEILSLKVLQVCIVVITSSTTQASLLLEIRHDLSSFSSCVKQQSYRALKELSKTVPFTTFAQTVVEISIFKDWKTIVSIAFTYSIHRQKTKTYLSTQKVYFYTSKLSKFAFSVFETLAKFQGIPTSCFGDNSFGNFSLVVVHCPYSNFFPHLLFLLYNQY